MNIYVRFWNAAQSSIREIVASEEACADMLIKRVMDIQEKKSAAEAQYQSSMVKNLPQYSEENLSPHDCMLRILSNGENDLQLMRQGIQMFLDIFASRTNKDLSTKDDSMKELLMGHLDTLLFPSHEFMRWCNEKFSKIDEIERKIQEAKDLIASVPPLNYIGRIIISYTDDTEQKVIAKYGGKRWRRIENFLRGVTNGRTDAIDIPGRKLGEDFVALRESNIPIHQHSEILSIIEQTQQQEWAAKDKAGSIKIVNTTGGGSGNRRTIDINNVQRNYQISPLEYPNKEE